MPISKLNLTIALAVVFWLLPVGTYAEDSIAAKVTGVFERVRGHEFNPIDPEGRTFTFDKHLHTAGIASMSDVDWKVRLLALRDLVRAGKNGAAAIARGLQDENIHVRYLAAKALGVLKAKQAAPSLERLLRKDEEPIVRAYAAMALGQMVSKDSLPLLRDRLTNDPHRDVQHQCELAVGQIEREMGATAALQSAYTGLNESAFESVQVGRAAPGFVLEDTEGRSRTLDGLRNDGWLLLIWIFADWCPVCHGEFRELIDLRDEFEKANVRVATVETHDTWRGRVMVGKEIEPDYWFSDESFKAEYTDQIWWSHLLDRAGAVGAAYGVDPMAFAVHAEFINRPATVIIDPQGIVRFAYYGTYWGDRPSIAKTLDMIRTKSFDFVHPKRLKDTSSSQPHG